MVTRNWRDDLLPVFLVLGSSAVWLLVAFSVPATIVSWLLHLFLVHCNVFLSIAMFIGFVLDCVFVFDWIGGYT